MVYVLNVTVIDEGETPTITPTPTPVPLPNLVLETFDICVEGASCLPLVENEEFSNSRKSHHYLGELPTEEVAQLRSPTDLRLYADGKYHEGEYLIGRDTDTFAIPILGPGKSVGQTETNQEES